MDSTAGAGQRQARALGRTISIRGISKRFGETQANSNISFDIRGGSIHGIVGQNGAGKSTLMKVIFGLERPDAGEILFDDVPLHVDSPRAALAKGIGLVAQELALVDELTALDNLILGHEPGRGPFIDRAKALATANSIEASLGFALPWQRPVSELSIAEKQQIEVLRLLMLGADTLIFDEPTAALAPPQVAAFLELLKRLSGEGRTIVFISHKLREVFAICDDITVLREGQHVGTFPAAGVDVQRVSTLMVGAQLSEVSDTGNAPGDPVLTVEALTYRDARGIYRFRDVTCSFRAHAITGVCGVTGNGQEQFMQALAGVIRVTDGAVNLNGAVITSQNVNNRRNAGIAYIPADRKSEGLAQVASVLENCIAGFQYVLARGRWLTKSTMRRHAAALLESFEVVHGDLSAPVSTLSGGNQQKLMLGREIMHAPAVLLASQPTRGVDIGGIQTIHQMLRRERDRGAAVLVESEDLDELLTLSDEVIVFFGGRLVATFHQPFDRQLIGEAMVGAGAYAN